MDDLHEGQKELVEEVLNTLTEKFETMSIMNRNSLAMATVEAAAVIAAVEADSYGQILGYSRPEVENRIQRYVDFFRTNAVGGLSDL